MYNKVGDDGEGDSWNQFGRAMLAAGVSVVDADVPHTGCCKAYALVLMR
jgi:hypothetical protein